MPDTPALPLPACLLAGLDRRRHALAELERAGREAREQHRRRQWLELRLAFGADLEADLDSPEDARELLVATCPLAPPEGFAGDELEWTFRLFTLPAPVPGHVLEEVGFVECYYRRVVSGASWSRVQPLGWPGYDPHGQGAAGSWPWLSRPAGPGCLTRKCRSLWEALLWACGDREDRPTPEEDPPF